MRAAHYIHRDGKTTNHTQKHAGALTTRESDQGQQTTQKLSGKEPHMGAQVRLTTSTGPRGNEQAHAGGAVCVWVWGGRGRQSGDKMYTHAIGTPTYIQTH